MTDEKNDTAIFLVDDHPLVRDGLVHLLSAAGYFVAGQAGGIREARSHPALTASDLVIVDLSLEKEDGLELLKQLRHSGQRMIVLSMHESSSIIRRALEAGAVGYVTKREAATSLIEAVETILQGGQYLSSRAEAALREQEPIDDLTGQQRRLYKLLGQGFSNEEIAHEMNISIRTIESYCVRIMNKLNLQSMKELRQQAIRDAATRLPE
ncbi:MAG: response regulator transcription factor [Spartobacteria bacterium]|nr:response regulator transcription factor [Spartobacteria bacterium]